MKEVIRQLPKNLKTEDQQEFSSLGDYEKFIDEQKIDILANVKIDGHGMVYRNFWPLMASFSNGTLPKIPRSRRWLFFDFNYGPKSFLANPFLLKNYFGKKQIIITEPTLFFTDDWSNGFFHWLGDALPRLLFAREYWNKNVILIPASLQKFEFITSSLKILGIKNIRWIAENEIIFAKKLIIPTAAATTGNFNPEIMKQLRELLHQPGLQAASPFGQKIYISRANAKKRKIGNEEELKPVLLKYGFQIIEPEKLNFLEQLAVFSQTKYLISIHGAGLTNMLFMPERSSVLEFNIYQHYFCYYSLASALNLNYFYQKPINEKMVNSTLVLKISPAELEKNIKLMLS